MGKRGRAGREEEERKWVRERRWMGEGVDIAWPDL